MFPKTLPPKTAKLLLALKDDDIINPFYLSGGTALSLHLGHRESEDLDFFTPKTFDNLKLQQGLEKFGPLEEVQPDKGTLNLYLAGVQLQFLLYPYQLLKPLVKWQGINLASVIDIACTKLQTISSRGSKKDFIDLWMILKKYPLKKLFSALEKKYPGIDYNTPHILKSLVYFLDAEKQPLPRTHIEINWEQVKKDLVKTVQGFKLG